MRQALTVLGIAFAIIVSSGASRADLLGVRNAELTLLRVHEVDGRFGPPSDRIDVEVVIRVAGRDGSFGFQLRNDDNRPARQGMLALLRDAFVNDGIKVNFDYRVDPPKKNGTIIRIWLTK